MEGCTTTPIGAAVSDSPPPPCLVLAVETDHSNEYARAFVASAERVGWSGILLGGGMPGGFDFTKRMRLYAAALRELGEAWNETVVVLSDARDVLVLRSPEAFAAAFRDVSRGRPMLVSMELFCGGVLEVGDDVVRIANCTPLHRYWRSNAPRTAPHRRFVNCGLVSGTRSALLRWLEWSLRSELAYDDQLALGAYMNAFPHEVAADVDAQVLHTSVFGVVSALGGEAQVRDAPSLAALLGLGPFFLHLSGTARQQRLLYRAVRAFQAEPSHHPDAFRAMARAPGPGRWHEAWNLTEQVAPLRDAAATSLD
jgi:hypothetical protein